MATTAQIDTLVIGGGQAGLAAAYHLGKASRGATVVEQSAAIGDSWRKRYASLTLFTPRSLSALPGTPLLGDQAGYATRDEFADYLAAYAGRLGATISLGVSVATLDKTDGMFRAVLSSGATMTAQNVVVATGPFQHPVHPAQSAGFADNVRQLDPEAYSEPSEIEPGPVLVVGDGASGRDIAYDLAATHETYLASGKPRRLFPERILGRSTWWWLKSLGLMRARPDGLIGRLMRRADPFPDRNRNITALTKRGVRLLPRVVSAAGDRATCADGQVIQVKTVIWAVGYRGDFSWLQIADAKDTAGNPLHKSGISPVPGLFFIGRPWQRNRASALVLGAGDDARYIVEQILERAPHQPASQNVASP